MLRIYYGRDNLNKEKFIFDNLKTRALVMTPDQYTLKMERAGFDCLNRESLMDIEIMSPNDLGRNILKELGGQKRKMINKYGRHMLLYKSAKSAASSLSVFKGLELKNSFLESVNNFISEAKQYNLKPADLTEIAAEFPEGSYSAKKLEDLQVIFSKYEDAIKDKYIDSEDYVDLYISKMKESKILKGNDIWFYGFDSLAPKTLAMVREMLLTAENVSIVLTWDDDEDNDAFKLTDIVIKNLEKLALSVGQETEKTKIPDSYRVNAREEFDLIEKGLYKIRPDIGEKSEHVTLVKAANYYNEAETAASFIKDLVVEKGYRYRDIKVICNDEESIAPILRRMLLEYGIEGFFDGSREIVSNPIIQMVTSLIDVITDNYRTESIFGVHKSGFTDIDVNDLAEIENYGIKYKLKGTMWKNELKFIEGGDTEKLAKLEEVRKALVCHFEPLEEVFKSSTVSEFLEKFWKYLEEEYRMTDRIASLMSNYHDRGLLELEEEAGRIWKSLGELFEQINEIMGDEAFDKKVFRDIFKVGVNDIKIGVLPPTVDGLIIDNIQGSYSGKVKALVIVGMNEGIIPRNEVPKGLFTKDEKELFKGCGEELGKIDDVRSLEEKLHCYRNFTLGTEEIYASYSISDIQGKECLPSELFTKLERIFDVEAEPDILNQKNRKGLLNSSISGLRNITRELQERDKKLPEEFEEAVSWLYENEPEKIDLIRGNLAFTNEAEELGKNLAEALYQKNKDEFATSISQMEKYIRCPFSYFVERGLKPEKLRLFEIDAGRYGDIYHSVLMEVTNELLEEEVKVTDPGSKWMNITETELKKLVDDILENIADSYSDRILKYSNSEKYRKDRIRELSEDICWNMVQQVRFGEIDEIQAEAEFKRGKEIPPIVFKVDDKTIYVEGKIDRIDYMPNGRVKVIDYKTGNTKYDPEKIKAGYSLQLMLYLKAVTEDGLKPGLKPGGAFYFKVDDSNYEAKDENFSQDKFNEEFFKKCKLDGVMVADLKVIKEIAGDFKGYSKVAYLRNGKEGIVGSGEDRLLSETEVVELENLVWQKIQDGAEALLSGKIEAHPMKPEGAESVCTYCDYKGICRFDTVFKGCSYNIVKKA